MRDGGQATCGGGGGGVGNQLILRCVRSSITAMLVEKELRRFATLKVLAEDGLDELT